MINTLTDMYITILPVIAAGVSNMVFTHTGLYRRYRIPIDGEIVLSDGMRLFGDHKTWIGFFSMILFNAVWQVIFGCLWNLTGLAQRCDYYALHQADVLFSLFAGSVSGAVYMVCELPNSFVKRRLGIKDGKTDSGLKGAVFFVADQIDSITGVAVFIGLISGISPLRTAGYILLGGITHISVNLFLYKIKIRKNI